MCHVAIAKVTLRSIALRTAPIRARTAPVRAVRARNVPQGSIPSRSATCPFRRIHTENLKLQNVSSHFTSFYFLLLLHNREAMPLPLFTCNTCGFQYNTTQAGQSHVRNNSLCRKLRSKGVTVAFPPLAPKAVRVDTNYAAYVPYFDLPAMEVNADEEPEAPEVGEGQGVVIGRYLPWRRRSAVAGPPLDGDIDANEEEVCEADNVMTTEEKWTKMVVRCLRTAGPRGTPLDSAGMDKILKLITDPGFHPDYVAVRSGFDVKKYLDRMWMGEEVALTTKRNLLRDTDPPEWKNVAPETLSVKAGDALAALIDIVQTEEAALWAQWEAKPLEGGAIGGPETAARALRIAEKVKGRWGEDVLPLYWSVYSDETHLDSRGHMKSHPVSVKYGLAKGEWQYSSQASRLVAYVPTPPPVADMAWAPYVKQRKIEIFHEAMRIAFEGLLMASNQ